MKKILMMFAMIMLTAQIAWSGDVVTKDLNKLPASARELVKKHFPNSKISHIKIDKDIFQSASYDVMLSDGSKIDFNSKGEWREIDCKKTAVPSAFIPATISKYIKDNFTGQKIVKIERSRKGSDVTLDNGLDVKFDPYGGFLKLDD